LTVHLTCTTGSASVGYLSKLRGIFIVKVSFKEGSYDMHFTHAGVGKEPVFTKGWTNFGILGTFDIPAPVILTPVAACTPPDLIFEVL
jgi:hypothetical protein